MSIDKEFLKKHGMTKAEYKRVEKQEAIECAKENEEYMLSHGYHRGVHGSLQPDLKPKRKMKLSWRIKIRLHAWHLRIDPWFPLRKYKKANRRKRKNGKMV